MKVLSKVFDGRYWVLGGVVLVLVLVVAGMAGAERPERPAVRLSGQLMRLDGDGSCGCSL